MHRLYTTTLSYSSIVYIGLKGNAAKLLSSTNPKVKVRFPLRSEYMSSSTASKKSATTAASPQKGWLSKKKKPTKAKKVKKTSTPRSRKKKTTVGTAKRRGSNGSRAKKKTKASANMSQPEIIDMLDDSNSESEDEILPRKRPSRRLSARNAAKKIQNSNDSDDLFIDDSSENEF